MRFEPVISEDLNELKRFQPEGWPDIIQDFLLYVNSPFCFPIKAVTNGGILGIGASICFNKSGWLAHIIVDKDYRNRGIGSQIVHELLSNLRELFVESFLLIATEMGCPIYKKAGFREVTEYCYLKRLKSSNTVYKPPNIVPFTEEFRQNIYGIDKKISGENRERLLGDYLKGSWVYIENGSVMGYFIPHLKDGPIIANRDEVGIELMKLKYSTINTAVLPSENSLGIDFLKQHGFEDSGVKGVRMIIGKDVNWIPKSIYGRIGGNFG